MFEFRAFFKHCGRMIINVAERAGKAASLANRAATGKGV